MPFRSKPFRLSCILFSALVAAVSAFANPEAERPFDLEGNPAAKSLKQFSRQSKLSIVFDSRAVKKIQTNPVSGILLPETALRYLLANTGLRFTQDSQTGAFAVFKDPSQKESQSLSPEEQKREKKKLSRLLRKIVFLIDPERDPHAPPADPADAITLSPFITSAEKSIKYQASNTQSATRMDVPLEDVPFNLQVITQDFMEDTMSFGGAPLPFGGGANREAVNWMGSVEGKSVRGFDTREFLRNGFLRYADTGSATIDRIEIIKGPTSVLDGVTSPGGVINVVTKKPNPHYDFSRFKFVYGQPLDRLVANFDLNRRLAFRTDGKAFASFRLAGGYEKSSYLSLHRKRELLNIMPSLLLQFSEKTLLGLQYEHYSVNGERGNEIHGFNKTVEVEAENGLHGKVPLYIHYGIDMYASWDGPDFSTPENVDDTLISLQHRFSDNFVFNIDYNHHHRTTNWNPFIYNREVTTENEKVYISHAWRKIERSQNVEGLRANLALKFDLGPSQHRFVVGFLEQDDESPSTRFDFLDTEGQFLVSKYLLHDPKPDLRFPQPASHIAQPTILSNTLTQSYYINHHATWLDGRITTLWGLYNASLNTRETTTPPNQSKNLLETINYNTRKAMPQAGLVYSINDQVNLYLNYSQSMQGNAGLLDGFDKLFQETPGEIHEIGSKFRLWSGRLNGTLSAFEIVETNRIVFDPEAPNADNPSSDESLPLGANVSVGELNSTGFDADLFFNPFKNFNTVFSYGYKTVEVTQDPDGSKVGKYQNSFKHKVGLFNKYTWLEGPLSGASAHLGIIWRSRRQIHPNRFGEPAFAKDQYNIQLGGGYQFDLGEIRYRISVAAKNLFKLNQRWRGYVPGTRDPYYTENPAEYLASLDIEF